MIVKHHYQCSFCNNSTTCFVFMGFSMVFSMCKPCYEQFVEDSTNYEVMDDICSLCDQQKEVKTISGFDNWRFFGDMHVCSPCLNKMRYLVEHEN